MQDTNGLLQKSIEQITTKNNESLKALENARAKSHELELQLEQAKSNNSYNLGWVVAFIVALLFIFSLFF